VVTGRAPRCYNVFKKEQKLKDYKKEDGGAAPQDESPTRFGKSRVDLSPINKMKDSLCKVKALQKMLD